MKSFRFEPVRWGASLLALLVAVETVNEAADLLPHSWTPWILSAIAVLTLLLGERVRGIVTALAAPRDDAGNRLVPVSMRGDTPGLPRP
jgi:hypothetical protein